MKYSWRNPARLAAEKLSSGLDMLCRSSINSILLAVALLGATLSACASNRSDRSQSVKPVSEVATSLPEERFLTLYGQFDAICVNADPTIEAVGKLAEQAGFARVNERALAGTGRAAWILTDERSRGGEINASTLLELRELSEAGELKLQCAISVSGSDTDKAVSRNAAEAAQAFLASIFEVGELQEVAESDVLGLKQYVFGFNSKTTPRFVGGYLYVGGMQRLYLKK